MEEQKENREDVKKILQLVENGKLDGNNAKGMIGILARKKPPERAKQIVEAIIFVLFTSVLIYALTFYLPTHIEINVLLIVYGFFGVVTICWTLVALVAIRSRRRTVNMERLEAELMSKDKSVETS